MAGTLGYKHASANLCSPTPAPAQLETTEREEREPFTDGEEQRQQSTQGSPETSALACREPSREPGHSSENDGSKTSKCREQRGKKNNFWTRVRRAASTIQIIPRDQETHRSKSKGKNWGQFLVCRERVGGQLTGKSRSQKQRDIEEMGSGKNRPQPKRAPGTSEASCLQGVILLEAYTKIRDVFLCAGAWLRRHASDILPSCNDRAWTQ